MPLCVSSEVTLSTIDETGWQLGSAEEFHLKDPTRFLIPSHHERCSLRVGDKVKLLFLFLQEDGRGEYILCERMWVVIKEVGDSRYVGILDSIPKTQGLLKQGDSIEFRPEHVASVFILINDPRHPDATEPN